MPVQIWSHPRVWARTVGPIQLEERGSGDSCEAAIHRAFACSSRDWGECGLIHSTKWSPAAAQIYVRNERSWLEMGGCGAWQDKR